MYWLTWRQHRMELLVAAALLLLAALPLIVTGVTMHEQYRSDGIAACVADPASRGGCGQLIEQFVDRYDQWANRLLWGAFLPALAGTFVGAPLLAREYEQGTWRLAFTQSVSRTRWLLTKLALVGSAVVVVGAAFGALFTWWRGPLNEIDGRLGAISFLIASPSLAAAGLFAFATGVLAGALLRRTIVAMAAALGTFLAVRLPLEEYVRPHYQAPLVRITDPQPGVETARLPDTDWIVQNSWVDAAGHRLTDGEESAIIRQVYGGADALYSSDARVESFMIDHGLRHWTEYHPDSSFWTFQAIEAGGFVALAVVFLAVAVWLVRRS
ncbi:ABC transporter permease [Actinoplanes sichuanensis]|uniref:ABC transporter permease subunit n=1 Tax=Actinoplanes sichuanensis TaxID=512349 RepID=A0ABW4AIG0_9ACTN|nr:ABC transporter permease subunit [Actinoplanes sichuanensis]BEL03895.1 ABC transporter permease [Actinoplanes sichuanensis]